MNLQIREIKPEDNLTLKELIRNSLKNHALDIPGTAYFDSTLDNLSDFYLNSKKRGYYVLADELGKAVGGIGFAEFPALKNCAELQKLYLADSVKGLGWSYKLISFIETKMKESGYTRSYLETHANLQTAIHVYEKIGYERIERPEGVVHGAMTHFFCKNL